MYVYIYIYVHEMLPVRDVSERNPGSPMRALEPEGKRPRLCLLAGGIIRLQPLEKRLRSCEVQGARTYHLLEHP